MATHDREDDDSPSLAAIARPDDPRRWWIADAACLDPDEGTALADFFVAAGRNITEATLDVCRACPVRRECLQWAYEERIDSGYFGGVSAGFRRNRPLAEALAFVASDPPRRRRPKAPRSGRADAA